MLNPTIGRWNGTDPVYKPHESPYAYAANNPIRFIDWMGLDTVDINYNDDGLWEITNTQIIEGDDVFRVTKDGETTNHTFSEGEYGERIVMLNLESTDEQTLGVYHISGEEIELGRTGYYVTPGGEASTEIGSGARLPADTYDLASGEAGDWKQIWVTNGASSGYVGGRGVKLHFARDRAAGWTEGCFVLSSSYTKSGGAVQFDFEESRVATMLMDYHLGASYIYKYMDHKYDGAGRIGATFEQLEQKLILKDGF